MAANRIKGITIEIGGDTTDLQKSLKGVNQDLKTTQADLKDVNKLLKLDPGNIELLRQKQTLLGKATDDLREKLAKEKEALKQMQSAGNTAENQRQQDALQREIIETTAELERMEKQYDACNPKLEAFATKTGQAAEATKGLSKAGAVVAGGMLANAVAAGKAADDINTLAKQYGVSTEEIQKWRIASDTIDVSVEDMAASYAKLTKQMGSNAEVFEKLDVETKNADGSYRDANAVWNESLIALSNVANETERDILAQELFGKSAANLAGIIDDGGAALRAMGEAAKEDGLILSQDALDGANAFNDGLDRLKATAGQAFMEAGASLAESLLPALEKLVGWVSSVVTWFGNLDGSTQTTILVIAGLVAALSPALSLISKIATVLPILKTAMLALSGPVGIVVAAIAGLTAAGIALYKNWDTVKAKAKEIWESITGIFKGAIEKIKNFFGGFKIELPKIKLPHFKISGGFSIVPPRVPKLTIDWYRKAYDNPVMFTSPTVLPTMNGLKGFGDGTGAEIVMGMNKLQQLVGAGSSPTINIYQQPGESATELAAKVQRVLVAQQRQREVAW